MFEALTRKTREIFGKPNEEVVFLFYENNGGKRVQLKASQEKNIAFDNVEKTKDPIVPKSFMIPCAAPKEIESFAVLSTLASLEKSKKYIVFFVNRDAHLCTPELLSKSNG